MPIIFAECGWAGSLGHASIGQLPGRWRTSLLEWASKFIPGTNGNSIAPVNPRRRNPYAGCPSTLKYRRPEGVSVHHSAPRHPARLGLPSRPWPRSNRYGRTAPMECVMPPRANRALPDTPLHFVADNHPWVLGRFVIPSGLRSPVIAQLSGPASCPTHPRPAVGGCWTGNSGACRPSCPPNDCIRSCLPCVV